jgi:hypothetical protein
MKSFILLTLLALPAAISRAQTADVIRLPAVVVTGRADSLLEVAPSATVGTVGAAQLQHRPLLRPGEVLETVPGVIITQHSGGGKANQFFLRGFNLDHGTDLATTVADMPVNLPSHGHGQGYTDLNFMIPELIETVDYRKGSYFADQGDFASAGAATILQLEGGSYGYGRFLFASSPAVGAGHLLYAFEASHSDGPWDHPDDLQRFNGVARYSREDTDTGYSFTAMGCHGKWDATDQIAHRAPIGRFDSLNPTDGGHSQRSSLSGEWHGTDGLATTRFSARRTN